MRTTLTLDEDLSLRLADLARESRQPFKKVVNQAIRRGLGASSPQETPFILNPHNGGLRSGIDPRRLNELAWEPEEKLPHRDPPVWGA